LLDLRSNYYEVPKLDTDGVSGNSEFI